MNGKLKCQRTTSVAVAQLKKANCNHLTLCRVLDNELKKRNVNTFSPFWVIDKYEK